MSVMGHGSRTLVVGSHCWLEMDIFSLARSAAAASGGAPQPAQHRKWLLRSKGAAHRRLLRLRGDTDAKLRKANKKAVHEFDVIALEQCERGRGQGGYRRWTPRGMLLAAFKPIKPAKRKVAKGKRRAYTSVVAKSARASAEHMEGCHTHVQKVRDALAWTFKKHQQERIEAMLCVQPYLAVLEVRFDETHHEMRVARESIGVGLQQFFESGYFPLVMLKGTLTWCPDQSVAPISQELVVSPAALSECCTAETLWAAIRQRLPISWDTLSSHCKYVVLVLGHDSHSGNLRLVRAIIEAVPPNVVVLSSRCAMHQLQLVLCSTYSTQQLSFSNALFCLAKLMHHGPYITDLRRWMHKLLDKRFNVTYMKPDPSALEWSRQLVDLCYVHAGAEDTEDSIVIQYALLCLCCFHPPSTPTLPTRAFHFPLSLLHLHLPFPPTHISWFLGGLPSTQSSSVYC